MADFRAISGVSATLRALLVDRMELPDGMTIVPSAGLVTIPITIGPPPPAPKEDAPTQESPRINLFLYRVTENGYLQNQQIPGRGAPSEYGHPPLTLNLHYLLTAYGSNKSKTEATPAAFDEFDAHVLLGSAMRVFHDVPIVTDRLMTVRAPSGRIVLDEALRDEFEQIKLSLEPLTLEDVTKVWSALLQRYRLSAAYVVNVVQIESRRARRFPRPVGQPVSATIPPLPTDPPSPGPMVYVQTIHTPTITGLRVRRAAATDEQSYPYAAIGDTLILLGTSLASPATSVLVGDVLVPAVIARGDRVEVMVPDDTIQGVGAIPAELRLQPGARMLRIVAHDPFVPQSSVSSNDVPFMLVPSVRGAPVYEAGPPRSIRILGERLVPTGPGGETIIGRSTVLRAAYLTARSNEIKVPIPDTLPSRNVRVTVSAPLGDPVAIRQGGRKLSITIGATSAVFTADIGDSVGLVELAGIMGGLIHDAAQDDDPQFARARVDVWTRGGEGRLVIVAGGLDQPVEFSSPDNPFLAEDLALTSAQVTLLDSACLSGTLGAALQLSSTDPRVDLAIDGTTVTLPIPKTTSLRGLASSIESAIVASGGAVAFTAARVAPSGAQLLVMPGANGVSVAFGPSSGDDRTVAEMQLRARFAIRVRVNGAESIDDASVELPQ